MITKEAIEKIANEFLKETENYLVDVVVRPGNKILVEIDHFNGVSIKDCISLSRHIESQFDRDQEDFELQVSSPGLDQPLKIRRQYEKYVGKAVEVLTTGGEKETGVLTNLGEESVTLEREVKKKEGKKNVKVKEQVVLPFSEIKETRIVISFK